MLIMSAKLHVSLYSKQTYHISSGEWTAWLFLHLTPMAIRNFLNDCMLLTTNIQNKISVLGNGLSHCHKSSTVWGIYFELVRGLSRQGVSYSKFICMTQIQGKLDVTDNRAKSCYLKNCSGLLQSSLLMDAHLTNTSAHLCSPAKTLKNTQWCRHTMLVNESILNMVSQREVPENINTHSIDGHWKFWEGSQKLKFLQESKKPNWNFPRDGEVHTRWVGRPTYSFN